MSSWTPQDWTVFFGVLTTFLTTVGGLVTTIWLQVKGNAKTKASMAISVDNNEKLHAVVAQTNSIGGAVNVSTAPTDTILNKEKIQ